MLAAAEFLKTEHLALVSIQLTLGIFMSDRVQSTVDTQTKLLNHA